MAIRDRARGFMWIALGVAAVVVALQLDASGVRGQDPIPETAIVAAYFSGNDDGPTIILANGDLWRCGVNPYGPCEWTLRGNFYALTGVIPASRASMGGVKQQFR